MHQIVSNKQFAWIDGCILGGAGFFIIALFVSAVFDPKIRLLHCLQALIYLTVIFLTRRRSAWGFGAGFFMALLWNYSNLFVTSFFKAGMQQLAILLRTGHLHRPDLLVAVVAVFGHFVLIGACLTGFIFMRPKARSWGQFIAGGLIAIGYFVAIVFTTGPQYIGVIRRTFHL